MAETSRQFAERYIAAGTRALAGLDPSKIAEVIQTVGRARRTGNRVYAIGNGGSASTASHFANDLGKGASLGSRKRFKVISLTDNVAWMTALSNDISYEDLFVEQLRNFAEPGDVLIGFSGSGNSENVLRAVRYANEIGCRTIGFVGFDGGELAGLVHLPVVVDSAHMGHIEDVHMMLQHMICYYFMETEGS